jgi:hypothetical protein
MSDALPVARNHIANLERWAKGAQERGDESTAGIWFSVAHTVQALADDYERLREASRPIPSGYGDISDLPPSLRKQLAFLRTDELDDQIFMIVKAAQNGADLDVILIELWRRFQIEQTRRFIQNKAYRLAQKGIIHSVPGRKGLYAATPDDAKRLSPVAPSATNPPQGAAAEDVAADFRDLDFDEFEAFESDDGPEPDQEKGV